MFVVVAVLAGVVVFLALMRNDVEPPAVGAVGPPVQGDANAVQQLPPNTNLPPTGAATPVSPATRNGSRFASSTQSLLLRTNYGLAGAGGNVFNPADTLNRGKVGTGVVSPTPARDEREKQLLTMQGGATAGTSTRRTGNKL